jgi:hypothetical protein
MQGVRWIVVVSVAVGLAVARAGSPAMPAASAEEGARTTAADAASMRPRLEVDKPELDGGEVELGKLINFSFSLRNTGQLPLEIAKVKPSCGCVAADFDHTIPPNGVGTVRAVVKTAGMHGQISKHVTVFSNDPDRPTVTLTMTGRVIQSIEIFPSRDILLPLTPGRPASVEAVIRSNEKEPLEIQKVETSLDFIHARLLPPAPGTTGAASADHHVEISLEKAPATALFEATVTLHVNRPANPEIVLHVSGYPRTAVTATPPRLYFGELKAGPSIPTARTITLFRREGSFQVLEAKTEDPALTLQVDPSADGGYTDVRVIYRGGWQPGAIAGKITIRTSDPARPTIVVPYEATVSG